MSRAFRGSKSVILTLLVLAGIPSCRGEAAPTVAPLHKVVVLPFSIEPSPVQGSSDPRDGQKLMVLLAEEAASKAAQTMVSEGLAGIVERPPSPEEPEGRLTLRGAVRMPVSLPSDLHELRDDVQRGPLASATVMLLDADGKILREGKADLDWREVRWRKWPLRRYRPPEEVLMDAVDGVVTRAVRHLGEAGAPTTGRAPGAAGS